MISIPELREPYPFAIADQGFGLRGLPYNLTVAWNIMPYVGASYTGEHRCRQTQPTVCSN